MNVKEEVGKVLAKRINIENLKEEDELTALGLDSLDLVEVMLEIEEVFGIEFSSEEIEECKHLKDVLDLINKKIAK